MLRPRNFQTLEKLRRIWILVAKTDLEIILTQQQSYPPIIRLVDFLELTKSTLVRINLAVQTNYSNIVATAIFDSYQKEVMLLQV